MLLAAGERVQWRVERRQQQRQRGFFSLPPLSLLPLISSKNKGKLEEEVKRVKLFFFFIPFFSFSVSQCKCLLFPAPSSGAVCLGLPKICAAILSHQLTSASPRPPPRPRPRPFPTPLPEEPSFFIVVFCLVLLALHQQSYALNLFWQRH